MITADKARELMLESTNLEVTKKVRHQLENIERQIKIDAKEGFGISIIKDYASIYSLTLAILRQNGYNCYREDNNLVVAWC